MLQLLPVEILDQIVSYLPQARDLSNIARTSHILRSRIQVTLWRTFAKSRFPSLASTTAITPPVDEVKGLVALSRSYDRLSLLARDITDAGGGEIETNRNSRGLQNGRGNRSNQGVDRQSMGYVPVIDGHEEMVGGKWNCRNEIVVWTAGPKITYRYRIRGENQDEIMDGNVIVDQYSSRSLHAHFKEPGSKAGRDDWTALQLLRPAGSVFQPNDGNQSFSIVAGAASGQISMIESIVNTTKLQDIQHQRVKQFQGSSSFAIRALDISPSQRFVLSASASRSLDLFDTQTESKIVPYISTLTLDSDRQRWSGRFLSETTILAGTGPSTTPIQVHLISPTGIVPTALRTYTSPTATSVYSLLSLPPSASGSSHTGQVFLSGQSYSQIFLRDLRSPSESESQFSDPTDDGAVYSLLSKGLERLVAGSSVNTVMKIYDLRMPNGRNYRYKPLPRTSHSRSPVHTAANPETGWTIFLRKNITNISNTRPQRRGNFWVPRQNPADARANFSPVYSLSSPSSYSPTIYAGLEGRVVEIDMVDVHDPYPDPLFNVPNSVRDVKEFWDPKGEALELAGYDQRTNKLVKQTTGLRKAGISSMAGLDERWGLSGI